MAQAGSNYEKNWRSKISLDCPFKYLLKRHKLSNLWYHFGNSRACVTIENNIREFPKNIFVFLPEEGKRGGMKKTPLIKSKFTSTKLFDKI